MGHGWAERQDMVISSSTTSAEISDETRSSLDRVTIVMDNISRITV